MCDRDSVFAEIQRLFHAHVDSQACEVSDSGRVDPWQLSLLHRAGVLLDVFWLPFKFKVKRWRVTGDVGVFQPQRSGRIAAIAWSAEVQSDVFDTCLVDLDRRVVVNRPHVDFRHVHQGE